MISLLDLPRELRDQIYDLCLINHHDPHHRIEFCAIRGDGARLQAQNPHNSVISRLMTNRNQQRNHIRSSLNFLQTCCQIYWEAAHFFYSKNTFCFSTASIPCILQPRASNKANTAADAEVLWPLLNKIQSVRIMDIGVYHPGDIVSLCACLLTRIYRNGPEIFTYNRHQYKRLEIELCRTMVQHDIYYVIHRAIITADETYLYLAEDAMHILALIGELISSTVELYNGERAHPVDLITLQPDESKGNQQQAHWMIKPRAATI